MGQARRKKRLLEKKQQEIKRVESGIDKKTHELDVLADHVERIQASIEPLMKELDGLTGELQAELDEVCNRIGPKIFPKDDQTIARFFLENKVFDLDSEGGIDVKGRLPSLIVRLASRLTRFVREPKNASSLREASVTVQKILGDGKWTEWADVTGFVVGLVFAKRILTEKTKNQEGYDPSLYIPFKEIDWSKHMNKDEVVHHAKAAVNAFLKDHERNLTGRALAAKRISDDLPPQGRKEVIASLEVDADGDFKALRDVVVPLFSAKYPVIESDKRSEAFMALFEMVADWMQEGWMKGGRGRDEDVDAVAYLAAERIFLKGYEDSADTIDGHLKKVHKSPWGDNRLALFEKSLLAMQGALTGKALEAKRSYWNLSNDERTSLGRAIEDMPEKLIQSFERVIGTYLDRHQKRWEDGIDFEIVFESIHAHGGFDVPGVSDNMKDAFSYAITEKLLREGFQTSLLKEKEDWLPVVELWSDKELMSTGMTLWKQTYGAGGGDSDVAKRASEAAEGWGREVAAHGVMMNEQRAMVVAAVMGFTAKWAVHAYQRITTTHTYAAALMCSDADRTVLEDIEMQWHAFMICVPNGLLSYYDDELKIDGEYNRILVASFDHQATIVLLNQTGAKSNHRLVVQVSSTLADLLDVKELELSHTLGEQAVASSTKSKIQRIIILSKRLVAGLLLALQNQNNFKSRTSPARDGKKQREPGTEPAHRVVFVGAPLRVDCRPSVADYIKNGSPKRKGAPPQVQTLVRGHHKRQVVGVGRLGRKVIWIEPFWRGPEDAPILTRPKKVS